MTKQTAVVDVSAFTTDAKFRTWGLAMSTAMQASGLVKTSDTGQIDWTTVTKPVATNTQAGYEVYRFSDTLQSTAPVFLRIGYGSGGTASGNSPSTWLTVGTGSNGSGTITGPVIPAMQGYNTSVAADNTAMTGMFTQTSDGYCVMAFGLKVQNALTGSNGGFWVIDRTRNGTTGAATATGVGIWRLMPSGSTGPNLVYGIDFTSATAFTTAKSLLGNILSTAVSFASGSTIPLGKHYAPLATVFPSSALLSYYSTDIAQGSTFTASPFGASCTYYAAGTGLQYFDTAGQTSATQGAFRWDN